MYIYIYIHTHVARTVYVYIYVHQCMCGSHCSSAFIYQVWLASFAWLQRNFHSCIGPQSLLYCISDLLRSNFQWSSIFKQHAVYIQRFKGVKKIAMIQLRLRSLEFPWSVILCPLRDLFVLGVITCYNSSGNSTSTLDPVKSSFLNWNHL